MPHQPVSHYQSFFLVMFALTIGLSFTYSPGTEDVPSLEVWANNADNYGPIAGYAAKPQPLSTVRYGNPVGRGAGVSATTRGDLPQHQILYPLFPS